MMVALCQGVPGGTALLSAPRHIQLIRELFVQILVLLLPNLFPPALVREIHSQRSLDAAVSKMAMAVEVVAMAAMVIVMIIL